MMARVLVIGGGQSPEHEVSIASASAVAEALRAEGHVVSTATIDLRGVWRVEGTASDASPGESIARALSLLTRIDVVFPAVHGAPGEDGALAGLCALVGVRMVGSPLRAGAIGMDKWATKLVARAVGVTTARADLICAADIGDVQFVGEVVVKPVSAGSSYGVSLVTEARELLPSLRAAAMLDQRILLEEVVRGREIDVAVLREADGIRWVAPPLEIHADAIFDTAMKYDGSARFTVPAHLSAVEASALERAAIVMFDALGCAGVARMDFFLTPDGPVLNEVNTMPGLTASSQVPRMFAAAGIGYGELMSRLVHAAEVPRP